MSAKWFIEATALFATTSGALLAFLSHQRLQRLLDQQAQPAVLAQHRRLGYALAIIAASLAMQCAAMFFG